MSDAHPEDGITARRYHDKTEIELDGPCFRVASVADNVVQRLGATRWTTGRFRFGKVAFGRYPD